MKFRQLAPMLALAPLLAGCDTASHSEFPPVCPQIAPLPTAQDISLFRPGSIHDIADLQFEGSILGAGGSCRDGVQGKTEIASVALVFRFQRGPAATSPGVGRVPYFVAVARGETILSKQVFLMPVAFPPNVDSATARSKPVEVELPVGADRSAAAYTVWVGFQKTER
jgi:hypothetical protein